MRIYGGLKPEDWTHWGQFTTFKSNAPDLLARELRASQVIYCSPLVDPYQPVEAEVAMMPRILEVLGRHPPKMFVVQTRGPLVLRDVALLKALGARVSFSITTDRDDVRRIYEPHCAPIEERFETVRALRAAGIETFATLAPILPCDPERLVAMAMEATERPVIAEPFHIRATKARGATTREAAERISAKHGFSMWHEAEFQAGIIARMARVAGGRFGYGIAGFARLVEDGVNR
jgi:DNA repair photolyase